METDSLTDSEETSTFSGSDSDESSEGFVQVLTAEVGSLSVITKFNFDVERGSNIRRRLFDEDPGEVSVNVQLQQLRLKMARKLCSQVSSIASARAEDAVPYPAVSLSPPTTRNKTKASDAKPTTSLPKPQPLAELKRSQLDPPVPIVKRRYCEDQNTQQQAMAYRASQKPLMRTSRIESTEAVRVVVPSPVKEEKYENHHRSSSMDLESELEYHQPIKRESCQSRPLTKQKKRSDF